MFGIDIRETVWYYGGYEEDGLWSWEMHGAVSELYVMTGLVLVVLSL